VADAPLEPASKFCDRCGATLLTAAEAPARFASPDYTPKHRCIGISTLAVHAPYGKIEGQGCQ